MFYIHCAIHFFMAYVIIQKKDKGELSMKITFMGAGSTVFAKNVIGDTMLSPILWDAEFALYDIDASRLEDSRTVISFLNESMNMGLYGDRL